MTNDDSEARPDRANWRLGQRVSRRDNEELGTVIEISGAALKVKWDDGSTSYYRAYSPGNVKLAETK
jgi:hypothetical protein